MGKLTYVMFTMQDRLRIYVVLLEIWRPFCEDFFKVFKGVAMPYYRLPCGTSLGNVACNINIPLLDVWYLEETNYVSLDVYSMLISPIRRMGEEFLCIICWWSNDMWVVNILERESYKEIQRRFCRNFPRNE